MAVRCAAIATGSDEMRACGGNVATTGHSPRGIGKWLHRGCALLLGFAACIPPRAPASPPPESPQGLTSLAKQQFTELSSADARLLGPLDSMGYACLGEWKEETRECVAVPVCDSDRAINADRIRWLCTDPRVRIRIPPSGLTIEGGCFKGDLDLQYVDLPFPLRIRRSEFLGAIHLTGAKLPHLFLNGTTCAGLFANWLRVDGNAQLCDGFVSRGAVLLDSARIGGDLVLIGGHFGKPERGPYSIAARSLTVGASLLFAGKEQDNDDLNSGIRVDGGVDLTRATIADSFVCRRLNNPLGGRLRLGSARVGVLEDDETCWPTPGSLDLDGFAYDRFGEYSPTAVDRRLDWLARQLSTPFRAQPFEQLATVYRAIGADDQATQVSIAKERTRAQHLTHPLTWLAAHLEQAEHQTGHLTGPFEWLWYHTLFPLIGYGYKPGWVLPIAAAVVVFGAVCFSFGNRLRIMVPTKEGVWRDEPGPPRALVDGYPKFNAFVYSLDAFTPLIDLFQGMYWTPTVNHRCEWGTRDWRRRACASFLRLYLWVHISLGWILSTLLALAITGWVKR